jgi:hypothetical protein
MADPLLELASVKAQLHQLTATLDDVKRQNGVLLTGSGDSIASCDAAPVARPVLLSCRRDADLNKVREANRRGDLEYRKLQGEVFGGGHMGSAGRAPQRACVAGGCVQRLQLGRCVRGAVPWRASAVVTKSKELQHLSVLMEEKESFAQQSRALQELLRQNAQSATSRWSRRRPRRAAVLQTAPTPAAVQVRRVVRRAGCALV